jgi:hypothetical protein
VLKAAAAVEDQLATWYPCRKSFVPLTSQLAITRGPCHPNAADGWMDRASDLVLSLESHEARRSLLDLIGIDVIHPPGKSYRAHGMPILRSRHYCDPRLVAEVYGVVWSASISLRTRFSPRLGGPNTSDSGLCRLPVLLGRAFFVLLRPRRFGLSPSLEEGSLVRNQISRSTNDWYLR